MTLRQARHSNTKEDRKRRTRYKGKTPYLEGTMTLEEDKDKPCFRKCTNLNK
jgi:hypothetical protein